MRFIRDYHKTGRDRMKPLLAMLYEARVIRGGEVITSPRMFFEVGLSNVHIDENIAADPERAIKFANIPSWFSSRPTLCITITTLRRCPSWLGTTWVLLLFMPRFPDDRPTKDRHDDPGRGHADAKSVSDAGRRGLIHGP